MIINFLQILQVRFNAFFTTKGQNSKHRKNKIIIFEKIVDLKKKFNFVIVYFTNLYL